ncbi:MAG: hypothetical protein ABW220_14225 [Burkholderiaceae bacterium]
MSHPFDLAPFVGQGHAICRGEVCEPGGHADPRDPGDHGLVRVRIPGAVSPLRCEVLNPDGPDAAFNGGDAVLVWSDGTDGGVILGRIGAQRPAAHPVVDAARLAERPDSLVLEAKGDIVLRNGQARIRLGAQGDVEIVCTSFATRSQRLLRLLAPMIKLN